VAAVATAGAGGTSATEGGETMARAGAAATAGTAETALIGVVTATRVVIRGAGGGIHPAEGRFSLLRR